MDRRTFIKSALVAATGAVMAKGLPTLAAAESVIAPGAAGGAAPTGWRAIAPTAIEDNPIALFGTNWMALAVGRQGDMNAMTVGWGALGTLWTLTNPVVTLYIEKSRYTYELLRRNEYFTLTAFPSEYREALSYLGSVSGRDEDKIQGSGLTPTFTEKGNPIFREGRLALECGKIYAAPFSREGMIGRRGLDSLASGREFVIHIGEIEGVFAK
jgi:flavin reductase (DIM6/NTAB) family NADH-FMN oxidoreductase RutF